MKYRIVEYHTGGYGIQKKNKFFSRWITLPYEPISRAKYAEEEIKKLIRLQKENAAKQTIKKIKKVCKVFKF